MREPDGSRLLDHSMICYGSAISDGNAHNNENLPILLAGGGGGGQWAAPPFYLQVGCSASRPTGQPRAIFTKAFSLR